ncbi:hypothetical protein Micbo1qcDRAFT_155630 [Microdochium bolleyi]|uniref:Uncharacterized protein n=1 Tax=Microdochium bolleyi TaxID=196109 RepID=A0A136JIE8_9PEZI|nr:hypothetical protein Micbo1qcDRAFT_155630 [Microdochium bolleyi]
MTLGRVLGLTLGCLLTLVTTENKDRQSFESARHFHLHVQSATFGRAPGGLTLTGREQFLWNLVARLNDTRSQRPMDSARTPRVAQIWSLGSPSASETQTGWASAWCRVTT